MKKRSVPTFYSFPPLLEAHQSSLRYMPAISCCLSLCTYEVKGGNIVADAAVLLYSVVQCTVDAAYLLYVARLPKLAAQQSDGQGIKHDSNFEHEPMREREREREFDYHRTQTNH